MKNPFLKTFLALLFILSGTNAVFPQIDEKYIGEKFTLVIIIWPESIRPNCKVSVDGIKLDVLTAFEMKNVFKTREYNTRNIDTIKVSCKGYYTHAKEGYEFEKPGINVYPIVLSRVVTYGKPKKCEKKPYKLKRNYALKLKKISIPDSVKSNLFYRDVDVDRDNNLLIVDAQNNRIIKNNRTIIKTKDLDSPEGIAIDSKGNIYITDWGNHRVVVFDSTGTFKYAFGEFGRNKNPNQGEKARFVFPTRIAIEEDTVGKEVVVAGKDTVMVYKEKHIFVADRYGIHKFDSQGHYLDTPVPANKYKGFPEGSFYGIAIRGYGENSELFVVRRDKGEIIRFKAVAK